MYIIETIESNFIAEYETLEEAREDLDYIIENDRMNGDNVEYRIAQVKDIEV